MPTPPLLNALAGALLAGEQSVEGVTARTARMLGRPWRWLRPLARRYLTAYEGKLRPRHREIVDFLRRDIGFIRARARHKLHIADWLHEPAAMLPAPAAEPWPVHPRESAGDLAVWLGLNPNELAWFADLKNLARKRPKLSHYHYLTLPKRSGGTRLLESPKPRLKAIQRKILTEILNVIPPHPAAHGFVRGRSIKSFVEPHIGRRIVLRMDLSDFFPSISGPRIQALFRTIGYPESVADLLGGLCTNSALAGPHLPQGAPTSPALANLCAWHLDCRLAALAKSAGARYTRYADDLAFSGDEEFERRAQRFATHVAVVAQEEGFAINHRKTRLMRQGVRQRLAGLVTNQRLNVAREDFDKLKATLTNCLRHGPQTQNRANHPAFRQHLEGRVGFVESINPAKGRKLRDLLDKIVW